MYLYFVQNYDVAQIQVVSYGKCIRLENEHGSSYHFAIPVNLSIQTKYLPENVQFAP
jgi:hypothetical protein